MAEFIQSLIQPPTAGSVLAALADISLKAALVLALAGIATSLTRRRPASVRHAIWLAAVAGVLALPALTAALPAWNVLPGDATAVRSVIPGEFEVERPVATEVAGVPVQEQTADDVAVAPENRAATDTAPSGPVIPAEAQRNMVVAAITDFVRSVASLHWAVLLFGVWAIGALAIFAHYLVGAFGLFLVARRAKPITTPEWTDLVEEIGDRLWITRDVRLYRSHVTTMPVTWGGLRPVVLLPSDSDTWTEERRRYVLAHEFAHIKRWDCTTQGVAQLACALYWFNPLVWVASRRLRVERERACDDHVLMMGGRPSSYAEHLLDIARSLKATLASPLGAVAMARPSQLEGRVLAILDPERRRRSFTRRHTGVVLGLALLIVAPIAAMAPALDAGAPETEALRLESSAAVEQADPFPASDAVSASEEAPEAAAVPSREDIARSMAPDMRGDRPAAVLPDTIDARKRKVVDAFIVALGDEDAEIRKHAAHALGDLEDERAIPALVEVMENDASREVRRAALWALSEMDARDLMPRILRLASSENDADTRRQIAWMIGENAERGDPEAGQALMGLLDDSDAEVRTMAVWGLAEMSYSPALEALVGMTADPDSEVRERAVWAVAEVAEDAPTESAVRALITALGSDDAEVRTMAAYGLGEMDARGATTALTRALEDSNAEVRQRAAWALGEIEDPAAVAGLTRALSDDNSDVRQSAANALMEIDTEESLRALAGGIRDGDPDVRRQALYAMAELEDPASVALLGEALRDPDLRMRKTAVSALADLEVQEAAPLLVEALRDESREVRRMAAYGLGELDSTPQIVSGLRSVMGDDDPGVRRAAISALGELEDYASAQALIDALGDSAPDNRRAAAYALGDILDDRPDAEAVAALCRMLTSDSSADNRKAAAYALGDIGSPDAIDALREALEDDNRDVRRAAANALGSIDWDEEDWDSDNDWDSGDSGRDPNNGGWEMDVRISNGSLAGIGAAVGEAVGHVVGEATHIALSSASAAVDAIDLDGVMHTIGHSLAEIDVEPWMDEIAAGLAEVDADIQYEINGALVEALMDVIASDPGSRQARAARRALGRVKDGRARDALRGLDR